MFDVASYIKIASRYNYVLLEPHKMKSNLNDTATTFEPTSVAAAKLAIAITLTSVNLSHSSVSCSSIS